MGSAAHLDITGAKGGESKPKSPVEAPDSLQSTNIAKLLLAVGEGEFDGTPTDRDIYLDNTPIMDASGNVNFPGVKWEWRRGTIEQDYIQGIPAVENETTVGVELRSDSPFSRALSDTKLSAVRVRMSWPRLVSQDEGGNTNGYRIEYAIDIATDGGAYVEAHLGAVDGKTTNGYQRSVRINLPKATSGWMLRVRRITPNANKGTIADTMTIAGYTEIIDEKLRYPNTALLYIEFDAQQFQNIPAVTVKCKAKRWPVPTNYDPVTRTYTGVWDGTFKQAWTNNPAFVTYGLCVDDRFGLGKRIKSWMVDKWEMYRIAQYCDQQVPTGQGGQEPRFLCDMNLQGRAEAWTLLRDLSAIYRGMVYWAHGSLFMQADMPRAQDIDYVFTRANVIDGDFVYGGAERNTHYSRALVSYDNPANNYDTDVIPVTDLALQRRYRDRPIELSAIGCTRASEAQRRGKWALLSNSQDRTVTFKTGMEGRIPLPGYVIPVADELVAGRPNGGRISAAAGRVVTLDRDTPIKAGDRLILNLPNGSAQGRTVQSVNDRKVTVTTAYSVSPEPELQWAIDYEDLAIQLFRVLKTSRTHEGQYEITALEFNPSKFAAIDTGARLEERPISVIPVTVVPPPASVTLTSSYAVNQGIAISTMTIAWPAVAGAVAYDVEWRKDNGNWIKLQRNGSTSVDVTGIYAGAYLARVRAVSAFDISSIWKSSNLTQLTGKDGIPPAVAYLNTTALVYGIGLAWGFPAGAEDTERTEIWYSKTNSRNDAIKLGDYAYPQAKHELHGLAAGVSFFFWARLIDRTGNIGPWYPTGVGVNGQSSADQSQYEEYFKDKITEGALYPALQDRIDLIDGPPSLPGSVSQRVEEVKDQVQAVNDRVTEVNTTVDDLNEELDRSVDELNQSVTLVRNDLQTQIDQVSSAAKSAEYQKEKAYSAGASTRLNDRLYQAKIAVPADSTGAKAPPNATYWFDVGQIVYQSNGLAARVTTVETKVTEQDGKLAAQSQRIDGVQSSLTVTNGNVTAAQQAADAANALAGGKGKVIIQSAAPAAADRLAQNLWIDTTGNANTPKRWTGSAWSAVTDKAATDAAAAAANALSVANTKADASVVDSISSRVTAAEGTITSQGQALTGLNNSLTTTNQNVTAAQQAADAANALAGGKGKVIIQSAAPAAADRLAQNLWIDTTGNANTPKRWTGSTWAAVTDKAATDAAAAAASALAQVATKADASTVSALSNAVTQQGQQITAQGQALTNIEASVGAIGGNGSNLLPAEYSVFSSTVPALVLGNGQAASVEPDPTAFNGYALRLLKTSGTGTTYFAPTAIYSGANIALKNKKYIASFFARSEGADKVMATSLRTISSSGEVRFAPGQNVAVTGAWARYSVLFDVTSPLFVADKMALTISASTNPADGIAVRVDRVMLEEQVGSSVEPSAFVIGNSAGQVAANAAATSALDARVTQTESGLTSQGSQITNLHNVVADKAEASAVNALTNRVTQTEQGLSSQGQAVTQLQNNLSTTNQSVTAAQQAADAANALAGGKGKVIIQSATPAAADRLAQNLWIDTTGNANTPKRWTGSTWAAVTDKAATDAAAAAASALAQVATKADASTVSALSNVVSQQGSTITAQGQSITKIQASIGNSTQENMLRNPDFNEAGDLVDNSTADFKMEYFSRGSAGVPANAPAERMLCMSKLRDVSGWGGQPLVFRNNSVRTPVTAGEVLNVECQMFCENATLNAGKIAISYWVQGSTSVNGNVRILGYVAAEGGWQKLTTQVTVPATATEISLYVVPDGPAVAGFKMWLANLGITRQSAGERAQASATQSLDARVTTTEGAITSQGSAITGLNSSLTATNQSVTAAQQAADAAATLAGSKGKVLVQTATPSAADRLAQNLWIDITGGANTPKRWNGSAWAAVTDKVATDAAAAAANALSVANTKADASTVQGLTNIVTQQGNTITAQGTEITNIKVSVSNVAGDNLLLDPTFSSSNGIGQAGTVLVRNDAAVPGGAPSPRVVRVSPATATGNTYYGFLSALNVRPPENGNSAQIAVVGGEVYDFELHTYFTQARGQSGLWIQFYDAAGTSIGHSWAVAAGDGERITTTAGSWVKLTGMAIVPAAAIRMSMALRVGAGDATDVFLSSPTARKRSGQDNAQAIATQSLDGRVTQTEEGLSSQSSQLTKLGNTVAGKADNSALQSLGSTVAQQGNTLNAQGTAVTQLQSTVGAIGGSGANLLIDTYSWLSSSAIPRIAISTAMPITSVMDAAVPSGYRYRVERGASANPWLMFCPTNNAAGWNIPLTPGKYLLSFYGDTNSAGVANGLKVRAAIWDGASRSPTDFAFTAIRTRYTAVITIGADTTGAVTLFLPAGNAGDVFWIDSIMVERQVGDGTTPSPFVAGPSASTVAGQATAISQLNTAVDQQGTAITAQASRLDGLYVQANPEMEGDSGGLAGEQGSLVGVWTEQSARVEDGIAQGKRIDTVQSQIGETSATVQQVSETVVDVNGRVSAMTTIKAVTSVGGRQVMAGLALGSDGETSEILAFAQRFAIVDESSGNLILPFVVQGGQVFISQAIINQAFIKEIIAGMSIRSAAVNSQGLPLLEINFATGAFTLRGQDANGSTLLNNGGLYVYDANNVERTAVGRMT